MTDSNTPDETVTAEPQAADGAPAIDIRLGLNEAEALCQLLPQIPQHVRIGMALRDKLAAAVKTIYLAKPPQAATPPADPTTEAQQAAAAPEAPQS